MSRDVSGNERRFLDRRNGKLIVVPLADGESRLDAMSWRSLTLRTTSAGATGEGSVPPAMVVVYRCDVVSSASGLFNIYS